MHIVSYQIDSMVIDRLIKKSYEDVLMNKQEVSISMLELSQWNQIIIGYLFNIKSW